MTIVFFLLMILLLVWELYAHRQQLAALHQRVALLRAEVSATSTLEYHRLQHQIAEADRWLHDRIVEARKSDLELANRLMELQYWSGRDYEAAWLSGLSRGSLRETRTVQQRAPRALRLADPKIDPPHPPGYSLW